MSDVQDQAASPHGQPSEEELRAAYEAELNRITSGEMIIQTTVSLLNLGGRRLGLAGESAGERDLEQVRDAIDAVRGLMPVLERRMGGELGPLRDALAQLQMAFAREANSAAAGHPGASTANSTTAERPDASGANSGAGERSDAPAAGSSTDAPTPGADAEGRPQDSAGSDGERPGPAQASGRLWVPGQ